MSDAATTSFATELRAALRQGPEQAAALLRPVLEGSVWTDRPDQVSIEAISALSALEFTEPERAGLRDALLRLLLTTQFDHASTPDSWLVGAISLAEQIQLLRNSPPRNVDLLWADVMRRGREGDENTGAVLALVAADGPTVGSSRWDTVFDRFGDVSTVACVEGVLRYGALPALEWIQRVVPERNLPPVLAAFLPVIEEADPEPTARYVDGLAHEAAWAEAARYLRRDRIRFQWWTADMSTVKEEVTLRAGISWVLTTDLDDVETALSALQDVDELDAADFVRRLPGSGRGA